VAARHVGFLVVALFLPQVHCEWSMPVDDNVTEADPRSLQGCPKIEKVSLQLKWLIQAQFAGYVAGREIGGAFGNLYKKNCILCQIRSGDPLLEPIDEVLERFSDVGIVSGSSFLDRVSKGLPVSSIGTLHKENGMVLVALKDFCGRTNPPCTLKDFEGKTVGVSRDANVPVRDLMAKHGVNVNYVIKGYGVGDLLTGKHAADGLMNYNEVGLILEALNPKTGYLYTPDDIIIWKNLQPPVDEVIVVRDDVLAARGKQIKGFLKGMIQAWTHCQHNEEECVGMLPNFDKAHQRYMLREINRMMYPNPNGFGHFKESIYWQTANVLTKMGMIGNVSQYKVNNTLIDEAREEVIASGLYEDVNGLKFNKPPLRFCAAKYTNNYDICKGLGATLCPAGQKPVDHDVCGPCEIGRFAADEDKGNVCLPCRAGKYADITSSTECKNCQPGTSQNATGRNSCSKCAPGKFVDDIAAEECEPCPKGTFTTLFGQESCERCPLGTFSDAVGQTACKTCAGSFTTRYPGAMQADDCVCKAGFYDGSILHGNNSGCMPCNDGLQCNEPGLTLPRGKPGYYVDNGRPEQMYLCEPKEACVGGAWGESFCRKPRKGFMCMECPDGLVLNDDFEANPDGCEECSQLGNVIACIVPFMVLAFCCFMMYHTHPSPLDEKPEAVDAGNTMGQLVMFVQVLNALYAARMVYGQPMEDLMNYLISQLDPDSLFSSAPCIMSAWADPLARYSMMIVAPLSFMLALSVAYLVGKIFFKGIFPLAGLINMIGEVLVEFYIAITLAVFSPFNCYGHPNGEQSVRSYPQVICGAPQHGAMVGLAVFGILAFPLSAIAVSGFLTFQFPRRILRNDIHFLVCGKFLFERWKPNCYWFCNVTLIRNFCIAVIPCVLPEDALDVTLFLMTMALSIAFLFLVWFKPRRTPSQNQLDCVVSFAQFVLVTLGLTTVHGDPMRAFLSTICVLMIALVAVSVGSMLCVRFYQLVTKMDRYSLFLSHHGGAGGASCRVLHRILLKKVKGKVFYDVDVKDQLGLILDSARSTRNMMVIFGSETLCKPWCIASLVAAHRRGTPLHAVVLTHPKPQETVCSALDDSKVQRTFSGKMPSKSGKAPTFEVDTFALCGYGLAQTDVHPAIQAITAVQPEFLNFLSEHKLNLTLKELFGRMVDVEGGITIAAATESLFRGARRCAQLTESGFNLEESANLILCDHVDGDAVSVSRLLQSVFCQNNQGTWLEDQDLAPADFAKLARSGKLLNTLFVFTQNSNKSVSQLARLGLLHQFQPEMHMVPVAVGVAFEFPDQDLFTQIETGKMPGLGLNSMHDLAACAGGQVTLKQISDGLLHAMSFLISFVDVPGLSGRRLETALLNILTRATGSGRRLSTSKQPPLLQPATEPVKQEAPETAVIPAPLPARTEEDDAAVETV